jgi:hypothetical protein
MIGPVLVSTRGFRRRYPLAIKNSTPSVRIFAIRQNTYGTNLGKLEERRFACSLGQAGVSQILEKQLGAGLRKLRAKKLPISFEVRTNLLAGADPSRLTRRKKAIFLSEKMTETSFSERAVKVKGANEINNRGPRAAWEECYLCRLPT